MTAGADTPSSSKTRSTTTSEAPHGTWLTLQQQPLVRSSPSTISSGRSIPSQKSSDVKLRYFTSSIEKGSGTPATWYDSHSGLARTIYRTKRIRRGSRHRSNPQPQLQGLFSAREDHATAPTSVDSNKSMIYGEVLDGIIRENQLDPSKPIESLSKYFADFRYSLYQPEHVMTDPIEEFLLERKAGHCEFFATTSVLLLRQMGVPARYVTGYAIQEYNPLLDMFVVRRRHAHAWAVAFIDGQWQTIDTTPSIWLEAEAEQSTFLQPVADVMSNLTFMFQVWWNDQKIEDYENYLYLIGLLLTLFILWRISRGEQVILDDDEEEEFEAGFKGPESPIIAVEELLTAEGFHRQPGELLSNWFSRIGHEELHKLLPLQQVALPSSRSRPGGTCRIAPRRGKRGGTTQRALSAG